MLPGLQGLKAKLDHRVEWGRLVWRDQRGRLVILELPDQLDRKDLRGLLVLLALLGHPVPQDRGVKLVPLDWPDLQVLWV